MIISINAGKAFDKMHPFMIRMDFFNKTKGKQREHNLNTIKLFMTNP